MLAERIRVTGIVQGVGFRPFVWQLAHECGVVGQVRNDAEGVLIQAWGSEQSLQNLVQRLEAEQPPLARIETITCSGLDNTEKAPGDFQIVSSQSGEAHTGVASDAATCSACLADVLDPDNRRYRYPFTNCTHCGPRLSIIKAIPYDRANTSMASFSMCPSCKSEYENPSDRRFHTQPNACGDCGPQVWLEDADGNRINLGEGCDAVETAARKIRSGSIVAIKGIGGIHLACDAGNEQAVRQLRERKYRYHKALALMALDVDMVKRFAEVSEAEAALLADKAAPIVVLPVTGEHLAASVAPAQNSLGFMLPYTPLHHLLMQAMTRPIVLTSGNRSDEPQTIMNDEARQRLGKIADYFLLHDRNIVNRLDDSVVRIADDAPRVLRYARGYAPEPIPLPDGFSQAGDILAMGAELKNTFCLHKDGRAILSQHIGDLKDAATFEDYRHNLQLYRQLFDFQPSQIVVDQHPDYLSTRLGQAMAHEEGLPLVEVQHHHAHIVACMAENGLPIDTGKVLGVALDGLGYGEDGTLWGGEFLQADYRGFERLAHFQAVPMLGGAQAMREPWRNTFAHLLSTLGWKYVSANYSELDIIRFLNNKPLATLEAMAEKKLNSPMSSSCGRLFDAVAAAIGVCREGVSYEGQAAIELEALAASEFHGEAQRGYPCDFSKGKPRIISWEPLWLALLEDIRQGVKPATMAARFHQGLVQAVAESAQGLCRQHGLGAVVLGGGVFQNRLLLEGISSRLRAADICVLSPQKVPANDGGIAFGQMLVAAARQAYYGRAGEIPT